MWFGCELKLSGLESEDQKGLKVRPSFGLLISTLRGKGEEMKSRGFSAKLCLAVERRSTPSQFDSIHF